MNVGSLFSGIGGIDLGLERAGMRVVFQCESDESRRSVLGVRFPGVPCHDDVRDVGIRQPRWVGWRSDEQLARERWTGGLRVARGGDTGAPGGKNAGDSCDLLCGGFPCQDLSVAGRRAGLMHEGGRSNLFFEFARVADELVPSAGFVLVENVPGLLSSNGGRDFAVVLATLAELGFHDLAWRVLDSRHFGVPQRRRRVFILGRRARGRCCAEILLEPEGGGGDPQAGGEAGPEFAVASLGGLEGGGPDDNDGQAGRIVTAFHQTQEPIIGDDFSPALGKTSIGMGIADTLTSGSHPGSNMPGRRREGDTNIVSYALNSKRGNCDDGESETFVPTDSAVRRLTPRECERLQGFPEDWTALGPDSRRYAALGDAVTVNVSEWIGRRIVMAA